MQVALIFGISRREELVNINLQDIEQHADIIQVLVKITSSKTNIRRHFTVDGTFRISLLLYMKRCRPINASYDRFFLNLVKGNCTTQVIEKKNKLGKMPKYLKLSNAAHNTGHSFRLTSATLLADSAADL